MMLWTIQSIAAWKILQREQVLFADQRHSEDLFHRCLQVDDKANGAPNRI